MWQRSCLRKALRRAATTFLTPKAEKTTAVASLKRAGEEGGCEEVLCTAYRTSIINSASLHPFLYVRCTDRHLQKLFLGHSGISKSTFTQ